VTDFRLVPIFLNTADVATHWPAKKKSLLSGWYSFDMARSEYENQIAHHTPMLRERELN
jgi:hypothetical protein